MEKRKIVYFIIAAIAFPIAIDWLVFSNAFPSHITNEAWAGFLGSYIGGLCTMAAVFITISDNNKKIKEQEKQRKLQQEEEKRLNIRPYLDTRYTYFEHDVKIGDMIEYLISRMNIQVWYILILAPLGVNKLRSPIKCKNQDFCALIISSVTWERVVQ